MNIVSVCMNAVLLNFKYTQNRNHKKSIAIYHFLLTELDTIKYSKTILRQDLQQLYTCTCTLWSRLFLSNRIPNSITLIQC